MSCASSKPLRLCGPLRLCAEPSLNNPGIPTTAKTGTSAKYYCRTWRLKKLTTLGKTSSGTSCPPG
jgi:hypothetical protein